MYTLVQFTRLVKGSFSQSNTILNSIVKRLEFFIDTRQLLLGKKVWHSTVSTLYTFGTPKENQMSAKPNRSSSSTSVELLRELIAAQQEGEEAVQSIIAGRLQAVGCEVEVVEYDPTKVPVVGEFADEIAGNPERRKAVVGRLRATDTALSSLLIFAHPDGEPVSNAESWLHALFEGQIENGRLYGWGVSDDLAGCAAAILALERASADSTPRGELVFASTPSKRYARGVAHLLHEGLKADGALYLHPAESGQGMNEIKAVASGHLEFIVTVTGKQPPTTEPSQTAFSHLGVNPIDKALVVRNALIDLADRRAQRIRHPLIEAEVGRATNLHMSSIICGNMMRLARLQERCEMGFGLSFPPGQTMRQVQDEVENAINDAAARDPWLKDNPPEIRWRSGVTGAEVPKEHRLWCVSNECVAQATGITPHVNPMHTSSDIRNPMIEAGIPCVGLGCLGGDLSQNGKHDEWVDVADFEQMVEVTAAIATAWCQGQRQDAPESIS